ncbi:hypothetical protein [Pseudoalteromonas sp. SCSIO 43201]|uniref:hypothetical protein n=1 Tax=Pseudoalteromonas sp. SCSIO 43201 TaxID=2822842 RepID=UPI00207667DC|nr:hypothetical protein [Pseudoalteromonas sp. SCSIO 43201]
MQIFFIGSQAPGLSEATISATPEIALSSEDYQFDANTKIQRTASFEQNLIEAVQAKPAVEIENHKNEQEPLKFQFAEHEVLFDLASLAQQDEAAFEELKRLLADIMVNPIKVTIGSKDQSQLLLFKNLELDFLAYKELSERLEMLAKLDHETESQKALAQQDRDRIRTVIASLHARLERGQETVLGGTTLKSLDLNRKDFELELDSLFTSVGFDSDMPVTGAT